MGSNLGAPEENLETAVTHLKALAEGRVTAVSGVYFTEPQNVSNQPWFANIALCMELASIWTPQKLLTQVKKIEEAMGRVESYRFGPRLIDIDILLFGDEEVDEPDLCIPHPRLSERAFALVPLLEIAPKLVLPNGVSLREILAQLDYRIVDRSIFQE
ncbi:MAG: 2-amino-4-hydroxy-6-hydroxymethyldihydropteridine diphosphokinase [Desulfovibrio sp.]|uniref:2-amino-4-hydroxy-6- hydroxymethyldihydropteridine diphosphokinase n=1 Tax=Desulfovibrio sp. 7SRBS1 TaxID=3378064 RepID=UPI003B3F2D84